MRRQPSGCRLQLHQHREVRRVRAREPVRAAFAAGASCRSAGACYPRHDGPPARSGAQGQSRVGPPDYADEGMLQYCEPSASCPPIRRAATRSSRWFGFTRWAEPGGYEPRPHWRLRCHRTAWPTLGAHGIAGALRGRDGATTAAITAQRTAPVHGVMKSTDAASDSSSTATRPPASPTIPSARRRAGSVCGPSRPRRSLRLSSDSSM